MKASEIVVGGTYTARVSGNFVAVRVDRIMDQTTWKGRAVKTYAVTNLATGRVLTFRSAAKFRGKATVAKTDS